MKAAREGQVAVMERLLEGGANINAKDGVSLTRQRCGWVVVKGSASDGMTHTGDGGNRCVLRWIRSAGLRS